MNQTNRKRQRCDKDEKNNISNASECSFNLEDPISDENELKVLKVKMTALEVENL